MKRLISAVLLITIFIGTLVVHADYDNVNKMKEMLTELNIVDENYFSNQDTVTRAECLVAIMRAIGVTDEEIEKLNGADLAGFVDTFPYSYFGCAYLAKIAYGEECIVDYETYRTSHTLKNTDIFFFPDRAVTVKETLAFMVRCLEENDEKDLAYAIEKAKEYGLIYSEDTFSNEIDSTMCQDDFYVLLDRFLHQKRYKYYDRANNEFRMDGYIDEEQSITYLEFLTQRCLAEQ